MIVQMLNFLKYLGKGNTTERLNNLTWKYD